MLTSRLFLFIVCTHVRLSHVILNHYNHYNSKTTKLKVYRNLSKPWITSGLLKSTKKKDKLYKKWLQSWTPQAESKYKKYKNKFTSVMRAAKNNYYNNKFCETKNGV